MATKEHALTGGDVVGQTVNIALDSVQANPWNPNEMAPDVRESLKHGLATDGWLASQALLVWGTNDDGERKMIIIDGEHRWTLARELGFKKGPAVILTGVTEAKAKSLTVALNHRRGESEEGKLRALLASIQEDFGETLGLDVGVSQDDLMKLLAVDAEDSGAIVPDALGRLPEVSEGPGAAHGEPTESGVSVRMVQLFLDSNNIETFNANLATLAKAFGTKTATDTIFQALANAVEALAEED